MYECNWNRLVRFSSFKWNWTGAKRRFNMRSKMSIKGHPIHPAMVALPIGLYFGTLLADVAYFVTQHDPMWVTVSFWAGIAAIVTALFAAIFGFGDYLTMPMDDKTHKIATTHMLSNLATVALFAVAAFFLKRDQVLSGDNMGLVTTLHVVGIAAMLFAGFLGGDMVYKRRLAVLSEEEQMEISGEASHHPAGG
jgi:uncharacterized membrane protein